MRRRRLMQIHTDPFAVGFTRNGTNRLQQQNEEQQRRKTPKCGYATNCANICPRCGANIPAAETPQSRDK